MAAPRVLRDGRARPTVLTLDGLCFESVAGLGDGESAVTLSSPEASVTVRLADEDALRLGFSTVALAVVTASYPEG